MSEKKPIARWDIPIHAMAKLELLPLRGDHVKDADEREGEEQEYAKVIEQLLTKRDNCRIASKYHMSHKNIYTEIHSMSLAMSVMLPEA